MLITRPYPRVRHFRQRTPHCVERPRQVHRQYIVPNLLRDFGKTGGLLDAGIVDENVWSAPGRNRIHHGVDGGGLAHIGIEKTGVRCPRLAHRSDGGVRLLARRKAVNREAGAGRGKRLADCEANTLDGAGHQRCPALKKAFLH